MALEHDFPVVYVVLSVHRPDPELFDRMLDSIVAQAEVDCRICAVLDGGSGLLDASILPSLQAARATIIDCPDHLGAREAFALGLRRSLAMASAQPDAAFAFADQDDIWHPAKLRRCIDILVQPGTALVHCDARVVSSAGDVLAPSLHRFERREQNRAMVDHLLVNSVTGMTAVFTAQTARRALRLLEDLSSTVLHDHVTALAAAASGEIRWISDVLVDYVQHDSNQVGAIARGRNRWWRIGWLLDMKSYRSQSLAIFRDRRKMVLKLAGEGVALGELGTMFLIGGKQSRPEVFAAYVRAGTRYVMRGQFRHWHLVIRCSDAALFRRTEAIEPETRAEDSPKLTSG